MLWKSYEGRFYHPRGRYHRLLKKLPDFRKSLKNLQDQENGVQQNFAEVFVEPWNPVLLVRRGSWCICWIFLMGFCFDLDFWNRDSCGCTWKSMSACVFFLFLNQTAFLETGVKNHFAVGKARESEFTRENNIYKALPMLFGWNISLQFWLVSLRIPLTFFSRCPGRVGGLLEKDFGKAFGNGCLSSILTWKILCTLCHILCWMFEIKSVAFQKKGNLASAYSPCGVSSLWSG